MIDARKIEVRSIEELIAALQPIRNAELGDDVARSRLRAIKNNISAVLSFTLFPAHESFENDPAYHEIVEEVRRQCLAINGMISRTMFRQRWLFASNSLEDMREITMRYERMVRAAYRMCFLTAPKLRNTLLESF